jgi:tRNA-specific 2-thiouridylase
MPAPRKKVVVAMSGGVDSSVAAALLLREGYEVIGVFMRLGSPDGVESRSESCDAELAPPTALPTNAGFAPRTNEPATHHSHKQGCCSVLDAADARRVAAALGIPLYVLNFQEDFGRVIDYFISEYNRGRTPNPCVRCNDWLKFGKLAQYAEAVGADYVASGHYARIGADPITGNKALLRGLDTHKDQSYVLFGMTRDTLDHTLLPIGDFEKPAVRAIAEELKLPVYNKPDSQEICFVPDQDYAALVKRRTPEAVKPGQLVDPAGQIIGEHPGHQHFTIGQRKGLKLALGHPVYVTDIDPVTNRVTLAQRDQLMKKSLTANQINLLTSRPIPIGHSFPCSAKIRYNHQPQSATATLISPTELRVDFDHPQSAITPGQAVVLYDQDVLLGGGMD